MEQMYACQLCGEACGPAYACADCKCLFYCSRQHQRIHAQYGHTTDDCTRMQGQLDRAQAIPIPALSKQLQTQDGLLAYLKQLGCDEPNAWLAACSSRPSNEEQDVAAAGVLQSAASTLTVDNRHWGALWQLKEAHMVPSLHGPSPAVAGGSCTQDWPSLYAALDIPPISPAAVLLSPVATLWYCLQHVLPCLGRPLPPAGGTVVIHYLGARYEADQLAVFLVLRKLLPHHHLHLHLVGPHVPEQFHGSCAALQVAGAGLADGVAAHLDTLTSGSASITLWCGCYHDVVAEWAHAASQAADTQQEQQQQQQQQCGPKGGPPVQHPHLVFAPNAGLPAYPSWVPTLQHLLLGAPAGQDGRATSSNAVSPAAGGRMGAPVLVTDFNEEAGHQSCRMVEALFGLKAAVAPHLNPFRSPVAAVAGGTALPSCSNGVLFGWLPGAGD